MDILKKFLPNGKIIEGDKLYRDEDINFIAADTVLYFMEEHFTSEAFSKVAPLFLEVVSNNLEHKYFVEELKKLNVELPKTPELIADTMLGAKSSARKFLKANIADVNKFEYVHPLRKDSRDFCRKHLDKTYTIKQIHKMKNKELEPVIIFCGGWGCGHAWEPDPF